MNCRICNAPLDSGLKVFCDPCIWAEARRQQSLAAATGSGARDWPEDFAGENGNYANRCICCQQTFVGHKRRMVCRECFEESKRKFEALSPEDQEALLEQQRQEVAEYMAKRLNP